MTMTGDDASTTPRGDQISALRAMAHPLRLRMLSLLTAEAMSAAEVARALDLTHANASYHLRVLHDAGALVVVDEQKVRGGRARRYRYDATRDPLPGGATTPEDRLADARATAVELERRLLASAPGAATFSDLEAWVPVDAWHRALDLLHEAAEVLHAAARPAGTPGTVHVSATSTAFTMAGGLTGEDVRWRP
jgi:DNA-binding transcriptional ArsR family regulator